MVTQRNGSNHSEFAWCYADSVRTDRPKVDLENLLPQVEFLKQHFSSAVDARDVAIVQKHTAESLERIEIGLQSLQPHTK